MAWQCSFNECNKCTTAVKDVDSRGSCVCGWGEKVYRNYLPSAQYFCEPKTATRKFINKLYCLLK